MIMKKQKSGAMPLFALVLVALALVSGAEQQVPASTRILGGAPAEPGEFPSMAALFVLKENGFFSCGGSVIDDRHILTAAHCVKDSISLNSTVELGCHKLSDCTDSVYKFEDFVIHPLFKKDFEEHDIAILRTDRPIEFTGQIGLGSVGAISIADNIEDDYRIGDSLTVAGWGLTSPPPEEIDSDILLKASLTAVLTSECETSTTLICTRAPPANACSGDSGGPLIRTQPDGSQLLVGLVSHGDKFCSPEHGTVFTRVGAYFDWIEESKRYWNYSSE